VSGIGDRDVHAQRGGEVVHPAGDVAGLDHQQRGGRAGGIVVLMRDEQIVDGLRRGLRRDEAVDVRGQVVDAQHAVELAQIERQDARDVGRIRLKVQRPMHGECSFRVKKVFEAPRSAATS
jgi:hypothetical protein